MGLNNSAGGVSDFIDCFERKIIVIATMVMETTLKSYVQIMKQMNMLNQEDIEMPMI